MFPGINTLIDKISDRQNKDRCFGSCCILSHLVEHYGILWPRPHLAERFSVKSASRREWCCRLPHCVEFSRIRTQMGMCWQDSTLLSCHLQSRNLYSLKILCNWLVSFADSVQTFPQLLRHGPECQGHAVSLRFGTSFSEQLQSQVQPTLHRSLNRRQSCATGQLRPSRRLKVTKLALLKCKMKWSRPWSMLPELWFANMATCVSTCKAYESCAERDGSWSHGQYITKAFGSAANCTWC